MDTGGVEATDLTEAHTRVPGGMPMYKEDKRSVDMEGGDEIKKMVESMMITELTAELNAS
jgi:hypothetical protein